MRADRMISPARPSAATSPASAPTNASPGSVATGRTARGASRKEPGIRIDAFEVLLRLSTPDGVRFEIRPQIAATAARPLALPLFEGWLSRAEIVVRARGYASAPFAASLELEGTKLSAEQAATIVGEADPHVPFTLELLAPLAAFAPHVGGQPRLALRVGDDRLLKLAQLGLTAIQAAGPHFATLDLVEVTDAQLFDGPMRRHYDLANPEEGFWAGTGKWRLALEASWGRGNGSAEVGSYQLDARPAHVSHAYVRANDATDLVWEDATRRAGDTHTRAELVFDSSHADLASLPPEGRDLPLDLAVRHNLTFEGGAAHLTWYAALPLRVRDPRAHLGSFQRLSAVGIDFGTSATVAALYQKGTRQLLRLGGQADDKAAENPTVLLIEDHERLWQEMDSSSRFPNLLRTVRASHAAVDATIAFPNAVVGELKSLPERVLGLDQSPLLRDRARQKDFLLDEPRVRALIRAYAYLLGRAINRPGQDVYLHYYLTHPAKFEERTRELVEQEIRRGLLLSIPEGIPEDAVTVEMRASEPEAFAAEVCPELAGSPQMEGLLNKFGEMRFAVFDFGGGTLDIACGRFRPATEDELADGGASTVIETLQVSGEAHLGGDHLTHELAWLVHQHEAHLPEMEHKEVPMTRPVTVPANALANKAYLYKRSVFARQNGVRFESELALEKVKHGPEFGPREVPLLTVAKIDGTETEVTSLDTDTKNVHDKLVKHLRTRIREGAKLLKNVLENMPWSAEQGNWRDEGVVILLAGNSSRSAFVEEALADELGIPGLRAYRPGSDIPFQQVVLYETPATTHRGVTVVGVGPKTAVAMGALKIANREVSLVRRTQGFSYFLGDLRGFPPKFEALVPMGAMPGDPNTEGPHFVDFGRWDGKTPLRASKEYTPGKMTSSDPRLMLVPTGFPPDARGRLRICVVSPDDIALVLDREGQPPLTNMLKLTKELRLRTLGQRMRVSPDIDVLAPEDLPAIIACMLLDAAVFPHPSVSFGTEVRRAGSRVWVIREQGEVRGFASLRVRLREGYVMGFAIDPEHQRRGLGGLLLDEILRFSRGVRLQRIDLHVSAENPAALALYESRDFRKSKHVPRFYGADEDAFVMSLRIR